MTAYGRSRFRLVLASCTALTAVVPAPTAANPEGGRVVAGQASISTPTQGHLVVRQGSARAVIDWRSFSIARGEHTQFVQPSSSAVALNRVTGPDPSVIAGRLSANGRIVLQNEAGVTFAEGAQVNASSMLATTSRIDAQRLMATGEVVANLPGRVAGARVENRGEITVADSGVAALVGPEVRNSGRIVARQGRVVLGGAETYTIDLAGDGLVAFEVRDPVSRAPSDGGAVVVNTGTIEAPGGQVVLSARAARGVVDDVIFAGGRIAATAVRQEGGAIVLGGGDAGTVTVAGNLDVSGQGAGQRGGTVDVRGERIAVRAGARIDASGSAGGGSVRIGGDLQGRGPGPNARRVGIERDAVILADATGQGAGGSAIVWSDEATRFWGRISARGGPEGGDGGFAEVSSKGWLDFRGMADLRATLGRTGVLLLDPTDLQISAAASADVTLGGTIVPTAPGGGGSVSTLNVTDLQNQLNLSDVIVRTVGSPDTGGTGAITIAADIVIPDPAGPDTRTLTLHAAGAIVQNAATSITVAGGGSARLVMQSGQGTGGAGGISLAGTIALGASGLLDLDATGGGTGAGGAIAQTAGSIAAAELRARAAGGVSITAAAVGTVAGSAGGAFSLAGTSAFTVGTVAGTTGITTTNQTITLAAPGTLTLDQAVNAGTGTVSLSAGAGAFLTVNEPVTAGAVNVVADRIAVNAALGGAGADAIDIATASAARPILIGTGSQLNNPGADTTALAVTQGEFGRLGAADATVRLRTTTGTVTISGGGGPGAGLDLGTRTLMLATGNTSATAITQTGAVTGAAGSALAASAAAGSVVLTDPGNDVPVISGRAGAAPGNTFSYASAGDVAVGTAQGAGAIPGVAGIVTTGAPISLTVGGALALNQAVSAPGGTVSLTTTGTGAISQAGTGVITANRLEIDASAGAQLAGALNQVATLAAVSIGGMQFQSAQGLDASALNTVSGAIGITAPDIEVVNDAGLGLTGVRNDAAAVSLAAGLTGTLTVTEPVVAATAANLLGQQVTVNDTVSAPTVVVAADSVAIDPLLGELGTATLTRAVLRTRTAGREIRVGDLAPGDELASLALGTAEFGRIGVGAGLFELRIGSLGGADRPGEAASGTLTIRGSGANFAGRALTLEAGSAGAVVTQDPGAVLQAGSLLARTAQGSVLLGEAGNHVGALAGSAGGASSDFEFLSFGTLLLDSLTHDAGAAVPGVTAGRTIGLEAVFGDVTQTAAGRVSAPTLLARSSFGEVDLSVSAANAVGTIAGSASTGFRYRDSDALTVGADPPSATSGVSIPGGGSPITLVAGTDLVLAAPVTAGAGGVVRLQAGQDLTQTAAGTITADALLARAGRDLLLDGANGSELPGLPGGTGGNAAGTVAAVSGRELWYRSAQGFTIGTVAADPGLVAGAAGVTGGAGATTRLAATPFGASITVAAPVAGEAVELAADGLSVGAAVGAAADLVVVRPFSAGRGIALGNLLLFDPLFFLSMTAASVDLLGGANTTIRIGSTGSASEAAAGAIAIRGTSGDAGTGIRVNRPGQPGDARTLVLETGAAGAGAISQSGPITGGAAATLVLAAPLGEALLGDAANDVGTLAGTAGAVGFRWRDGSTVAVGSTATVTAGGGQPLTALGRDGIVTPSLPITLLAGGNLDILRPVDAGAETIRLQAGGVLSQTAAGTLDAGALLARGGSVDLTGTGNRVGLIAGSSGTSGGFRFRHDGSLTVGTVAGDALVAGQAGLASNAVNAPVTVRVDGGDLTLASAVTTSFAGGSFVRLQAAGAIAQGAGGTISTQGLLARAGTSVTLEAANAVGTLAGEAASLFRFANTTNLAVGQIGADLTLVAAADGVSLGAGMGTTSLAAGSFGIGSLVLDRPVDAGTGSLTLLAGAFSGNVQQTATGGITSGSLGVTASAGGVDLASAGAANAVPTITGTGRDGFRFRAAGALAVGAGGIATTNAPLTLVAGGNLGVAGALSAGTGAVRLRALAGNITQAGGSISAGALAARADAGSVTLTGPGNAVGTFSAFASGAIAFTTAGAVTIGPTIADGPAESQAGVVNPAAELVPAFAGAVSTASSVTVSAGSFLTVNGTVDAATSVALSAGSDLDVNTLVEGGTDVTLTATNNLVVSGAVDAGGDAALTAGLGISVLPGASVLAGADATLTAGGAILVSPSATVQAGGAATLAAGTALDVSGTVDAGTDAVLTAGQGISVSGTVRAGDDASLDATTTLAVGGLVDATGDALLASGQAMTVAGSVTAGAAATLDAGAALSVQPGGQVQSGTTSTLTAVGGMTIDGIVDAGTDAVLTAGQGIGVSGSVLAAGTAALDAVNAVQISGLVDAGTAATLDAGGGLTVSGTGIVDAGTAATLTAGTDLTVAAGGQVIAGGTAALDAGQAVVVDGFVQGQSVILDAATSLAVGGVVASGPGGAATLDAGGTLSISGLVDAAGDATLDAGGALNVLAGATVRSGAASTLTAAAGITIDGAVDAGTDAVLTAGQGIGVSGSIRAAGSATLDAANAVAVSGLIDAGAAATLTAGADLTIAAGGLVQAGDAATLDAGQTLVVDGTLRAQSAALDATTSLTVGGLVQATADAALTAGTSLAVSATGAVAAGGSGTVAAANAVTIDGAVDAGTDAAVTAGQAMAVAGTVRAGDTAILGAGGALTLTGLVDAGADAALTAGQDLAVSATGRVAAGRDATLDAGGALTLDGAAAAARDLALTAGQAITIAGSATAGGAATLDAGTSFAVSGLVDAGTDAAIAAGQGAAIAATGRLEAGRDATLAAGGAITLDGTATAGRDLALAAGQTITVAGAASAGASATLAAPGAIAVPGTLTAGIDATLDAGGGVTIDGSVSAGRDAELDAGQGIAVAGNSVLAGRDARLFALGPITITGLVRAGADAVFAAGDDVLISGEVRAGRDALIGSGGAMRITGSVGAGTGGRLILGFATDFTLEGQLGAPDGRIMIRRAEQVPGGTGLIEFLGDEAQFLLGGAPEMIVVDATGDLRPLGTPDPGPDVGLLRDMLDALNLQTAGEIAANRIVRLDGFPSFVTQVTGIPTEFGRIGGDPDQSNVTVNLGLIDAPGTLLYVFGENGPVQSAQGIRDALRLVAVGVYVNAAADVSLFGIINGVAGDNASTYVQRLGDPQFRQLINECAIGTIGCTFLPLAQEPSIYIPPVLVLEGGMPRLDESSVPIVNTGPEDTLRISTAAAEGGEEDDEEEEQRALAPPDPQEIASR